MRRVALLFVFLTTPAIAAIGPGVWVPQIEKLGNSTGQTRWAASSATFFFHNGVSNLPTLPNVEAGSDPRTACNAAAAQWTSISALNYVDAGVTTLSSTAVDGVNLVTFADTPTNRSATNGAIAVTMYFFNNAFQLVDADIVFNPLMNFSTLGNPTRNDVQSVAAHEYGHAFGLSHSPVTTSTMFAGIELGSFRPTTLTPDDRAGILATYPTNAWFFSSGAISGTITKNGSPVYGAHVVARSLVSGETAASALSRPDGTYLMVGLPHGPYHVYAEPLDGPSFDTHIVTAFWTLGKDTVFPTTFFGAPTVVDVDATATTPNVDIAVPSTTPTNNLMFIGNPASSAGPYIAANVGFEVAQGASTFLLIAGPTVGGASNNSFTVAGTGVTLGALAAAGVVGGQPFKVFPMTVSPNAAPGARDVVMNAFGQVAVFCGGVDIRPSTPAGAEANRYGTACNSSIGPLALVAIGFPTIGNAGFSVVTLNTVVGQTHLLLAAARPDHLDLTQGCSLWVDINALLVPHTTFQMVVAVAGTVTPLAIPPLPQIAGFPLYLQALQVDPMTSLGFATSNGLELVIQ